jgi:hypothetical protein
MSAPAVCLCCEPRRKSLWLAKLAKSSREAIADGLSESISAAVTENGSDVPLQHPLVILEGFRAHSRLNGGVSPLYGSWERIGENRYSSRAYFFAFDPSGNPVVLLRVGQIFKRIYENGVTDVYT